MHRTTTAAALLVTVAVSALSGCVTAQHPPVPGAPSAPSHASAPRPDGLAEPRIVQAPAREALERVGPREALERLGPRHTPTPTEPAVSAAPRRFASLPGTAPAATPRSPRPAPSADAGPRLPDPVVAFPRDLPQPLPGAGDMCAPGRKYDGWGKDSTWTVICEEMYGR
ncbi:hypothetical protein ACFS5L_35855 [Streptomyces phyllanthi]|uniref:Lipoprotein n=1 Tax=Streptomyces phyllanthi TaxID=1803180 RepID=A0A5N8W3I2_9ACTN|nr:hypothetical protein [Streptomyces phyllanthi]MPY42067.1 hypothetical protein [Streptomyces phyllanthi]